MQLSHFVWMGGVVLIGTFIAGCATEPTQSTAISCGNNYTCLKDATFHYRQQAVQLSALAERYEIEGEGQGIGTRGRTSETPARPGEGVSVGSSAGG